LVFNRMTVFVGLNSKDARPLGSRSLTPQKHCYPLHNLKHLYINEYIESDICAFQPRPHWDTPRPRLLGTAEIHSQNLFGKLYRICTHPEAQFVFTIELYIVYLPFG
jgi:hypothetical protein